MILASGSGGYWYYDNLQKEEENYQNNISEAVLKIMAYSYISEEITNIYSSVWSDAIDSDYGITVNGKLAYDFNTAITYQREELDEKGILSSLKENTEEVDTLMKELNNPSTVSRSI